MSFIPLPISYNFKKGNKSQNYNQYCEKQIAQTLIRKTNQSINQSIKEQDSGPVQNKVRR